MKSKEAAVGVEDPPTLVARSNFSTFDTNRQSLNLSHLGIYGGLVGGLCVVSVIRTIGLFVLCMRSSVALHDNMFKSITRAPCRFFDINPVGEIPFEKLKAKKMFFCPQDGSSIGSPRISAPWTSSFLL